MRRITNNLMTKATLTIVALLAVTLLVLKPALAAGSVCSLGKDFFDTASFSDIMNKFTTCEEITFNMSSTDEDLYIIFDKPENDTAEYCDSLDKEVGVFPCIDGANNHCDVKFTATYTSGVHCKVTAEILTATPLSAYDGTDTDTEYSLPNMDYTYTKYIYFRAEPDEVGEGIINIDDSHDVTAINPYGGELNIGTGTYYSHCAMSVHKDDVFINNVNIAAGVSNAGLCIYGNNTLVADGEITGQTAVFNHGVGTLITSSLISGIYSIYSSGDNEVTVDSETEAEASGQILSPVKISEFDDDSDGIKNHVDNCPTVSNPGQGDEDGDKVGDACDNCPPHANPAQLPSEEEMCADYDGDGIPDFADECPMVYDPWNECSDFAESIITDSVKGKGCSLAANTPINPFSLLPLLISLVIFGVRRRREF